MKKRVSDYMELPYTIELTPDEDTFFARIKELDGCMTVGDTPAEALEFLEDAKYEWLVAALEDGLDIPLPEAMRASKYSGKFPLRMSTSLHQKLSESASCDGVSLNQYIVTLLSERNPLAEVRRMLVEQMAGLEQPSKQEVEPAGWAVEDKVQSCKVLPFEQRKQKVVGL